MGVWSFELQVTDAAGAPAATSTPTSVTVNAAPSVAVLPISWSMDAGASKSFTATASGGSGTYSSYQWYVGGVAQSGATTSSFSFSSVSVGSYSITVTVKDSLGTTSAQSPAASVTVNAAPLDHFVFSSVSSQTAGTSFSITVTAKDAFGNTAVGYVGTPSLSYSAGSISPTVMPSFVGGVGSVSVSVTVAGSGVSITATDGAHSGTSNTFTVNAGAATRLVVSSGTSQTAGTPFSVTVTAKDTNGNTATGYTGTVHFSSTDSGTGVSLPSNYAFKSGDLGTHTFTNTVTLMTVGTQSVTATDTAASSITGSQAGITVKVSSGIHLVVTGFPNPATAGSAGTVTVTVKDQYGNVFSGYTGTVKITSTDSSAVLPANAALTSGVGSFGVTLKTAGTQSIIATDTANSAINGSQTGIVVNHAATAVNVAISPSGSSVTSGASKTFSALASDTYGNSWNVTSSTSWSISSGAGGSWSSNVFTSATVGSWTVTGTFASIANTTGLIVNPAGLDHFAFALVGDQTAGSAFSVTVIAKDKSENNVTAYVGTPSLTVSAGAISPSVMSAFVNGVGSALVTVDTSGSGIIITATDGSVSGLSNSFAVTNAPTTAPTPAPTPAPYSTPTSTPNPKSTPSPTSTAKPSPSPTPTPLAPLPVKTVSGSTVEFAIKGNITASQIFNAKITSNQSASTSTLSFTLTGPGGTTGFSNITIPKTTIPYGTTPLILIDGQQAPNQGYKQDANNFYVWYTTHFSTHQVTIQFEGASSNSQSSFLPLLAVGLTVPEIVVLYVVIAVRRLKRKPENA